MKKSNDCWHAFKNNRGAMMALGVLIVMYSLAIGADIISPYSYKDEDRAYAYCPPTAIEFKDQGRWVRPFVYGRGLIFDGTHRRCYRIEPSQKYPLCFFAHGRLVSVDAPGRLYLWGADARGRDIFSRIWYGARISLSIGLWGVAISFILGLLVGGIAGYYGGWVDSVLMRVCELFMMMPGFYLMLALRSALPEQFNSVQVYLCVVLIMALIGWASLARIIRGMVLSLRERDFVWAAKSLGVSDMRIIVGHIVPQTISFALPQVILGVSASILAEAGLSMVGLGIQDPIPSWGNLLSDAMGIVPLLFAPWIVLPGVFIFITVTCFNMIGDALRDALDPMLSQKARP